jgi:hypothetical protein
LALAEAWSVGRNTTLNGRADAFGLSIRLGKVGQPYPLDSRQKIVRRLLPRAHYVAYRRKLKRRAPATAPRWGMAARVTMVVATTFSALCLMLEQVRS